MTFFEKIQPDMTFSGLNAYYRQKLAGRTGNALWQTLAGAKALHAALVSQTGKPLSSFEICENEHGKPGFSNSPGLFFNISHSGGMAVCELDSVPVGVDLQEIRPHSGALAKKVCSPEELKLLQSASDPEEMFIRLFARRESYYKMLGLPLRLRTDLEETSCSFDISRVKFNEYTYMLSICKRA